ncbi:Bax inhibitor-1/YccA family protein [bacterium]|nr:Bax inhibitor-1/YccA family protein [bacterium]
MSNPVMNKLDEYQHLENDTASVMTVSGTLTNFAILLILLLLPAAITWNWAALNYMDRVQAMTWIGAIAGFVLALIISFMPKSAPFLSPIYAVMEGMLVGGLSAVLEMSFKGIVVQAVSATLAVCFVMFALYKTGIIRATEKFRAVVISATLSIFLLYLVNLIMILFHFDALSNFLWSSNSLSITISVVICVVAALNLILDFDIIERYSQISAPKYMDWYCAFGLMVTIVWLYLEILRLLSKFSRR